MKKKNKQTPEESVDMEQSDQGVEVLDAPDPDNFEAKYNETLDRYQRTLAEFDNFRKRTTKEMASRYDDGIRATCEKLLPIIDNFERALNAHENKEDSFYQGVAMIAKQFDNTLSELGIEPIYIEPDTTFDPNLHNAVAHVEDEAFGQNVIMDVLQKGYIHKDKVIRHSMVRVAN